MLQRILSAVSGREARERLATIERAVRKLGESERDSAAAVEARLGELTRAAAEQPTAKDLRELRQTLKGIAAQQDDRWLFDAIDAVAASGRPILVGPWTGEVGFELLYWIPFLEWVRAQWQLPPERELIVSRGGVASWYGRGAAHYADAFAHIDTDEFRSAVSAEKRKHRRPGALDERLVDAVVATRGLGEVDVLHPGLMFRAFAPYWSDDAGFGRLDRFTRYRLLDPPAGERPAGLPADYVAVRFYYSECFPATADNRAFARHVVSSLAERTSVVVLNPGFSVDEHDDWIPDAPGTVMTIADGLTPERNLAVQSAVIGGARAFVGTYGGYSYLAPLYRVPSLAFYSRSTFKPHHLHAAQRAFAPLDAGALLPLDVAHASLVQLALGTLVTA